MIFTIHRTIRRCEMLPSADFVITNTQYNRPFIQALMTGGGTEIHTIYNGINLAEFNPPQRSAANAAPTRILCVGRLMEQKGLTYLLDACALLRERNIPFTCEVIGGTEEPLYTEYWERLKEQHRRLESRRLWFSFAAHSPSRPSWRLTARRTSSCSLVSSPRMAGETSRQTRSSRRWR